MSKNLRRTTGISSFGIALAVSAAATEQRVDKAVVPSAVLAAISGKYPKGTMTRFTREVAHGVTVFEVNVAVAKEGREVEVSVDGKILGEERTIPFHATPAAVQQAFARSRFAKGTVLRAEESTRYLPIRKVTYELLVELGKRKLELDYDPGGTLVGREAGEED